MTKKGFDRIAGFYDLLISLTSGNSLKLSRTYLLNFIKPVNSCLIVGGGTGESLLFILNKNLAESIVFIDASPKMVSIAKQKVIKNFPAQIDKVDFRIGFHHEMVKENEKYNLIITNYFLDVFSEDEILPNIQILKKVLDSEGCWICTDFYKSGYNFLKTTVFSLIIAVLYLFFNLTCSLKVKKLPQIPNNMKKSGFFNVKTAYFYKGLLRSDIWKISKD